ncbi:MAG TPA: CoA pyrophosphatase [Candidatus Sulfomarinibacteraceae bacterium]|nr:CoA pyrophosphatase [Candidatus Sulfomarinibacteraceae bacterium]
MNVRLPLSVRAIEEALHIDGFDGPAAQSKMKPLPRADSRSPQRAGQPRQGAVLLLLYNKSDQIYLVLTRRRDDLPTHAGQVALPGGRREGAETLQQTALREAYEEVGVEMGSITILGGLTPLYVAPSDFELHPFVGWHRRTPGFVAQPDEVAEIIEAPLYALLRSDAREEEMWERYGIPIQVPFFRIGPHKVWGATAMILSEFVERLQHGLDARR